MANDFGQSELVSFLLSEFDETPEAMAAVVQKYLESPTVLRHRDIDPMFEDLVVVLLRWIEQDQADLVKDFLERLQKLLLAQSTFEIPSLSLTAEKHLHTKLSTLGNILGIAIQITLNPMLRPGRSKA